MTTEVRNQIFKSPTAERYYFVKRALVLEGGLFKVIGSKVDVTESVQGLLRGTRDKHLLEGARILKEMLEGDQGLRELIPEERAWLETENASFQPVEEPKKAKRR